ncbi:MAG TPA: zinc-binding alcohol dehydrogenase [Capsulimonadaceae bacterium]|jgi:2-desacetyl-2-hydroxyethyl bacteriochlorophyllide A dehydrogenase
MSAKRFVFTGKQEVALEEFELEALKENEVRVQTRCSLMSTGTENIVFNRLFEAGTGWDGWVKYPFYPGYLAVGEITEVGSAVTDRTVGQRIALRGGHSSHHNFNAANTFPIPEGLDDQQAAWFGLGKIAFMGAKVSDYHLGDSVLIIGAGPIGQMSVRWASAAGLRHIVVVDPVAQRLELAKRGGATAVISKSVTECADDVKAAIGGKLPRIVNDSTGNSAVFSAALTLADRFGRVVILGDTGTPSGQHLTHDVINRGLTIVGAHDVHTNEQWNDATITELLFSLASSGRFDLSGLTSHVFAPADYASAYELANTKRGETMGIIFDWAK